MSKLRLFTAIALPEDIKQGAARLVKDLQTGAKFTGAHPKWVAAESLHVTLVFLGWIEEDRLPLVITAANEAASGFSGFEISLGDVSLFPDARNPRVIALGIGREVEALAAAQARLNMALRHAGFETEDRVFRPHITLARVESKKGLAGLKDLVKAHANRKVGSVRAQALTLYKSTLSSSGALYTVLHEAPLQ